MVVGISVFELHLPYARSLKQKRKVVKGLVERVHARLKVSIAETDHHDLHQRAEVSVALVARTEQEANQLMEAIRSVIDEEAEAVLLQWDPQILEGVA